MERQGCNQNENFAWTAGTEQLRIRLLSNALFATVAASLRLDFATPWNSADELIERRLACFSSHFDE
jgi:hypothetical protein